ncbi:MULTISPECIES: drug/metabolite exporter YedA [Gulbenkiania]|uniref:Permease of the drug/metabolite transporter (DMT) superfamily n=2 Tax=Gulbenkiania TaxID=397456 RepID=A0A0K6GTB2_9NEIS|nr:MULTISPECIES: drug/metabolite exporter YedA [Gulbenkiania]TCW31898.1 drug/metabolite transporter (DMT)-like permease [Gulbenkiania mobilis]CUA81994.1 Permease of the drug/metabolite transporter (DMT) superfamily [Gulbenkiania indica]
MPFKRLSAVTLAAFFALYVIWGSTYFAIRVGVEEWPPFMMAGVRFLMAGTVLFLYLKLRSTPNPSMREVLGGAILGVLMPGVGNGLVTLAEKDVSSGVAALVVATVPLFTTLFARLFGQPARWTEWGGIVLGLVGMALLNLGANLKASPSGALILVLASAGWALGSAWSKHLTQPKGLMSSAVMMLSGGLALLLASLARGETLAAWPSWHGWAALLYLVVFGSIIAYTAYLHLLKTVSAAAATSYAYVNPVIAVLLGVMLLGEHVGVHELGAMAVIVAGVLLIGWKR